MRLTLILLVSLLLVFRNNKLVAESYHKNENDITTRHLSWSSTKQVMGMLTGIAVDKGLIAMRSGIDYSNDGVGGETDKILREIPDNITEYILGRPMTYAPGTEFFYKDGDPQLMSAVIQSAAGKPADEWADEVLFSRIGVTNFKWVRYRDGTSLGGFGIEITPREMAKMAMCVAGGGSDH